MASPLPIAEQLERLQHIRQSLEQIHGSRLLASDSSKGDVTLQQHVEHVLEGIAQCQLERALKAFEEVIRENTTYRAKVLTADPTLLTRAGNPNDEDLRGRTLFWMTILEGDLLKYLVNGLEDHCACKNTPYGFYLKATKHGMEFRNIR